VEQRLLIGAGFWSRLGSPANQGIKHLVERALTGSLAPKQRCRKPSSPTEVVGHDAPAIGELGIVGLQFSDRRLRGHVGWARMQWFG